MNTKKIVLAVLVLSALAGLFVLNQRRSRNADISAFDQSFSALESYLAAAKEHDLEGVKSISYQLSDTCKDESKRAECETLMDNVAYFGQAFVRENMHLLGRDKKQVILAADYVINTEGEVPSATRPIAYFVIVDEKVKLLSFNPFQGAFFFRGEAATSTVIERLEASIKDTDGDAVPDKTEECKDNESDTSCVPTNPKKKDSDRDGWWDSIEALFYSSEDASELEE